MKTVIDKAAIVAFFIVVQGVWVPWLGIIDTSCRRVTSWGCGDQMSTGFMYFAASLFTALAVIALGAWIDFRKSSSKQSRGYY